MALKQYKPISDGLRHRISPDFSELKEKGQTEKKRKQQRKSVRSLTKRIATTAGRNNQGRITSRFRGGGHKKIYKQVDFLRRDKVGVEGTVQFLDYDPNRNCYIALVVYRDGEKRYIIAPEGLNSGDKIMNGSVASINIGNAMPLVNIPLGSFVHNVEISPKQGAVIARSAGSAVQLVAKEKGMAAVKLPSGELRWVLDDCYATIGRVSNSNFSNEKKGKAGRVRWLGRKPHIRGFAMNPNDHKHGGGEGRCPVGGPTPFTAFGKPHGLKTRSKRKRSNKLIISRRKK